MKKREDRTSANKGYWRVNCVKRLEHTLLEIEIEMTFEELGNQAL